MGIPFHALKAGAFQYDKKCGKINKEYMLCKREEGDPRKCLEYNVKVTDCAADFYKSVENHFYKLKILYHFIELFQMHVQKLFWILLNVLNIT